MSDYVFKISNKGDDVKTTADKDLFFNGDSPVLKSFKIADISMVCNGSGVGSATISHNLNYKPAYFIFLKGDTRDWFDADNNTYSNCFFPIGSLNNWYENQNIEYIQAISTDGQIDLSVNNASFANKTLNFRYILCVDPALSASGVSGLTASEYGLWISKKGKDVKTAEEYDLTFSSDYKALQFHNVHKFSEESITLPLNRASIDSQNQESGGYVDFNHNLGYQPFFIAYVQLGSTWYEMPYGNVDSSADPSESSLIGRSASGFCDSSKVRLFVSTRSKCYADDDDLDVSATYTQTTYKVKLIIFSLDLTGATYG